MIKKKKNIILILIFGIILFISYKNYILNNGFGSGDDISNLIFIGKADSSLVETFRSSYFNPTNIARPISTLLKVLTFKIFQENLILYNLTSFLTWFTIILILSISVKKIFGNITRLIFIILGSFPFFSSIIFFENYLFTSYMASIFFWSISLLFMIKYSEKKSASNLILGTLFLILSILTLEYVIPLLILNLLIPIINFYKSDVEKKYNLKSIFKEHKFIQIILLVILLFLIFKFLSVRIFFKNESVYGFAFNGLDSFLQSAYFFIMIIVELPILLFKTLFYISEIKYALIFFMLLIFYLYLSKTQINYVPIKLHKNYFFYAFILSLISCLIIYFLSFYPATSYGYYNRMTLPSFILLTILTSVIFQKMIASKKLVNIFFVIVISFLWLSSLNIQIDNFVKSWNIRKDILNKVSEQTKKVENFTDKILILNAPYYLSNNYNNEPVFFTTWNLRSHFYLLNKKKVLAWPISHRIISDKNYYPSHNINNFYQVIKNKKFLYLEISEGNELKVYNFSDYEELKVYLEKLKKRKINNHDLIFREKIRNKLISFVKSIK